MGKTEAQSVHTDVVQGQIHADRAVGNCQLGVGPIEHLVLELCRDHISIVDVVVELLYHRSSDTQRCEVCNEGDV
jgi:hypothetical protein